MNMKQVPFEKIRHGQEFRYRKIPYNFYLSSQGEDTYNAIGYSIVGNKPRLFLKFPPNCVITLI